MSNLTGTEIKDTYKDLLHMGNGNTGVTSSLVSIKDGEGTESALSISSTEVSVGGRVGIGTTHIARTLHIVDSTSDGSGGIKVQNYKPVIELLDANVDATATTLTQNQTKFTIANNGVDSLTIDSTGKVGIGTKDIKGKLELNNGTSAVELQFKETSTAFHRLGISKEGSLLQLGEFDNAGDIFTSILTVDADGNNVGIGTTSPGASLTAVSGGTIGGKDLTNACILAGSSSTGIGIDDNEIIKKQGTNGGGLNIGSVGADASITFKTGQNTDGTPYERMYISSNGNIGINTDSPEGKLEILHSGSWDSPSIHLKGNQPTMKFNDTDATDDWYIHVNNNNFLILVDRGASGNDDPIDDSSNIWETPHPLQLEGDTNTGYLFGEEIVTTDMFSFDASTQTLTINM